MIETKYSNSHMISMSKKIDFNKCFTVDVIGKKGGLALKWKSKTKLEIQNLVSYQFKDL